MSFPRIVLFGFGMLAVGACIFGALKFRAAQETRATVLALEQQHKAQQRRIATLETQLAASTHRTAAIEHDNTELKTAMGKFLPTKTVTTALPTRREVEIRVERGLEIAASSDPAMAIRELLWCFDEGSIGLRASPALMTKAGYALRKLREEHPPTLTALRESIEKLRQHLISPEGNRSEVSLLATLAGAAGDETVLLTVLDQLPPGDRRRSSIAIFAEDQLIAAHRYQDVVAGRSYESMRLGFDGIAQRAKDSTGERQVFAIQKAAKSIEALAGVGQLEQAREFSAKVLEYDRSPETIALLQTHLARAGQADLLSPVGK